MWRESIGLSRDALADQSGIPAGTIRNHETGVSEPKTEHLQKLALLGCDVGWLLTGQYGASGPFPAVKHPIPPSDGDPRAKRDEIDVDLIAEIETMLEEWLVRHDRRMDPRRRGRFIAEAYAFCMEEAARAQEPTDGIATRVVGRLLRLVA